MWRQCIAMKQKKLLSYNVSIMLLWATWMFVMGVFARIEIWRILLFLYLNLSTILLPGFFSLKWSDFHFKNSTTTLFVSFGIGYVYVALLYAILVFFNLHLFSPYILYTVSVLSLLVLLDHDMRNGIWNSLKDEGTDNKHLLVLMVVLLLFCFLVFVFPHRSVAGSGYLDMHFDNTYWFKNCIAATKGYPFPELSVLGSSLSWHMFSCFDIALFHFATGIEIYDLCFMFSPFWHVLIMLGGAYALMNEILSNKKYVFTGIVLVLLCSSAETYTSVYYLDHLWGCSMGTADAIATSMFGMLLFFKCIEDQCVIWRYAPLAILMLVSATGYKSANGAIVLVGVGSGLAYLCIRNRKAVISSFLMFTAIFVLFFVLCKTFIIAENALTSSTSNHRLVMNFTTIMRPELNFSIVTALKEIGISSPIAAIFLIVPYMLCVHPVMPLMGLILVTLLVKKKEVFCLSYKCLSVCIPLFSMFAAGVFVFLSFNHPGFAQCYFLFSCIPFVALLSFAVIEQFFNESYRKHQFYLYILIGCSFIATMACAKEVYTLEGKYIPDSSQLSHEGTSLTRTEFDGLRWARAHLPQDAVVVTNKVLAPIRGERSFITSAYAERQVYLEGYSSANLPNNHLVPDRLFLISQYFSGDRSAREKLIKEGITHVIIYKSLSDNSAETGDLLYENKEIIIRTI